MSLTFNGYAQNDAHEFLQFLLDKMNKELNQAKSIDGKYLQFKVPPSLTSLEKIVII